MLHIHLVCVFGSRASFCTSIKSTIRFKHFVFAERGHTKLHRQIRADRGVCAGTVHNKVTSHFFTVNHNANNSIPFKDGSGDSFAKDESGVL